MSTPTLIYLLRHGSTALNREVPYRLQGRGLDPELDAEGIDQARRAAEVLRPLKITHMFTSPLLRAIQTAEWLARTHGLSPTIIDDLIEASLGEWEGLTWDAAQASHPAQYAAFHKNPGTVPYPGGESFLDAQKRMVPTLGRLAQAHPGERIAVVSHNITNRAYLAGLLGIPIDRAREIRQSNCGINVISCVGVKSTVETVNSLFHLNAEV
jgi:broad specificity phosphatase PhoE